MVISQRQSKEKIKTDKDKFLANEIIILVLDNHTYLVWKIDGKTVNKGIGFENFG